jgi:hypothetical protein
MKDNNWQRIRKRKEEVRQRARETGTMYTACRVVGCNGQTRAASAEGLDTRYCRRHADHRSRHGDPVKGSYGASVVNPYRKAALDWIVASADDRWVVNAIDRVKGLYRRAGPHVEAFRLTGMNARERANAAWARLRTAEVDPRLPVAAWLAIEMVIRDDPQPATHRGGVEFRRVQAAKIVHRLASGTHKRWERQRPDGGVHVETLDVYPKSRGRVLRLIGEDLEEAAEWLAHHRLNDIVAFKSERTGHLRA